MRFVTIRYNYILYLHNLHYTCYHDVNELLSWLLEGDLAYSIVHNYDVYSLSLNFQFSNLSHEHLFDECLINIVFTVCIIDIGPLSYNISFIRLITRYSLLVMGLC